MIKGDSVVIFSSVRYRLKRYFQNGERKTKCHSNATFLESSTGLGNISNFCKSFTSKEKTLRTNLHLLSDMSRQERIYKKFANRFQKFACLGPACQKVFWSSKTK